MTRPANGLVLVVTGLAAEARSLRGPDTICVSAPPAFLAAKLDAAVGERSPVAVVSFGLAGGLAPGLRPGAVVLASNVMAQDETWPCNSTLRDKLLRTLENGGLDPVTGNLAACDAPVLTRAGKAELHRRTGALAVDTESHVAARLAARLDLPFLVLRAVTDVAESDLPPLAMRAIDANGRLDVPAIAGEILRRPGQLFQLPGTALSTAKAMRTLGRVRRLLGPRLGL